MEEIKKILIIRFSSLGDIILTEPIPRLLKEKYPKAEIHYLTKPGFAPLLRHFNSIDQIHLWQNKVKLIQSLRNLSFDLVIDLHDKLNSWIVKTLLFRSNTFTYQKRHFLRSMIVRKLSSDSINSTLNLYFSVFKKIDPQWYEYSDYSRVMPEQYFPHIDIKDSTLDQTYELFNNYQINPGKTLIGIFPGASYNTKQYSVNSLASFINRIPASWNCQFIILGSYQEKSLAVSLRNLCEIKPVDLCGKFNLDELLVFCSHLNEVISNDSGPMHIAAALKKPQIAIFGATHTRLGFKPLNNKARILESNIKCQPCSLHGSDTCPKNHFRCMKSISPSELYTQFKLMLEKNILQLD